MNLAPKEGTMNFNDINLPEVGRSIQLVGAVYADQHSAIMVLLPDADDVESPTPVAMDSEQWKAFLRQTDLVEFEATVEGPDGKLQRAIIRKSNRQISKIVSWNVFRRDDYTCRYCGRDDVPLTVDHLVTWESGGPHTEENLVASCSKCNNARGEMDFADWLLDAFYKRVSKGLSFEQRFANDAIAPRLANIERTPLKDGKKRKRR